MPTYKPRGGTRKIEDLKDEISAFDVIVELGGGFRNGWSGEWRPTTCPFHEDHVPSASTSRERFNCHGCGAPTDFRGPGDIVDIAKYHLGTSDVTRAIRWLEERFP